VQDTYETVAEKKKRLIDERVGHILAQTQYPAILPGQFVSLMENNTTDSRQKMENNALVRLHRGYNGEDTAGWVRSFIM